MEKSVRHLVTGLAVGALTWTAVLAAPARPASAEAEPCGAVMVGPADWLRGFGVAVRGNGAAHGTSGSCAGWSTANPSVQNGYGWSSAELAARLYRVRGWGTLRADGGEGAPYPYRHGARYLPEGSPGMTFNPNGDSYVPVPGDLVIESNDRWGHVAVVDRVTPTAVEAVEQNIGHGARHVYPRSGSTLTGAHSTRTNPAYVRGVLHSPLNCRAPGETCRVSLSNGGSQTRAPSYRPALSADGRVVVFNSESATLVPGDTNGRDDLFVRDRGSGRTTRITLGPGGEQANDTSNFTPAALSADGRQVAFTSRASNLVPGDTNDAVDVFVRDRIIGSTRRVSVATDGTQGNGFSSRPSLSADGRYVAFASYATNLVPRDTNGGGDVFVRDLVEGTTSRVSLTAAGAQANASSDEHPAISADGRYVAFVSIATNLVPGDTNETFDVFVRDREVGTTTRASVATGGAQASNWSSQSAISGDGRFVVFTSVATDLVPGDTNAVHDVFVRDRVAGTTTRVSSTHVGGPAAGYSTSDRDAVSADGRYIVFTSHAPDLVSGDTNAVDDVFVRDRVAGTTRRVSVASTGAQGDDESFLPALSADGRVVAFTSQATSLVRGDTNNTWDAFVHLLR